MSPVDVVRVCRGIRVAVYWACMLLVAAPVVAQDLPGIGPAERDARILDSAPTGIGVVVDRVFIHVNDHVLSLTGYTRDELVGHSIRMLYPTQEDYEFVGREWYGQIAETGRASAETRWIRKDGTILHVILAYAPLVPGELSAGVTFTVTDITKRVQAEEALRESEKRFATIFQDSPGPMVVSEIDTGKFIDVNASWVAMLGYSREEQIGRTSKEVGIWANPGDRDRAVAKLDKQGFFRNEPIRFRTKSGGERLALWSGEVVVIGGRRVLLSQLQDETERRLAEVSLMTRTRAFMITLVTFVFLLSGLVLWLMVLARQRRLAGVATQESNNLLQTVLDTIPVRVFWKDTESRFLGCNRLCAQDAGKESAADMVGLTDDMLIWHETAAECRRQDLDVVQSGLPNLHIEEPLTTTAGGQRIVCMSKLPLRNAQGQVVGVLGAYEDVTERVRAEKALLDSEQRFQTFMDQTPVFAYIKDETLTPIYLNHRVLELWEGENQNEGMVALSSLVEPEVAARLRKADERILSGEVDRVELEYQLEIHGESLWLADVKFALNLGEGRKAIGGMAFDVTGRRLAESEKEKLWGQLTQAQKMESIGRLAGGVAHDFNNMLQAILGYAELASSLLEPDHPRQEELAEITSVAERAAHITRQLLAFARRQTVQPRVLDLGEEVSGTMGMLRHLIGEDVALTWEPPQGLWPVKVDPGQVGMVLANLCVNARDAISGTGSIVIRCANVVIDEEYCVEHATARVGEYVVLSVEDDGCGMDEETKELVFEPFFTTKEVGRGTGLGLATVHGVAMQNGGFVSVETEVGSGTTFLVHFPKCLGKTQQELEPEAAGTNVSPLPRGTETILVVEDETSILQVCDAVLSKLGYRVLLANRPALAVDQARSFQGTIDLLLTDVVMPQANGRALAEEISRCRPGVPCLYMSGYPADAIAHHGILGEGLAFLQKPFSNRQLAEAVRNVLNRSGEK